MVPPRMIRNMMYPGVCMSGMMCMLLINYWADWSARQSHWSWVFKAFVGAVAELCLCSFSLVFCFVSACHPGFVGMPELQSFLLSGVHTGRGQDLFG